jgi:hypothetical protein|tara:strand:+ start:333 stop:581 length:249 start_codon:yes stop_codon:yes gene_type:complete
MPVNESLNTLPVQQFISVVKSADASKQREVKLDIETAKRLAFTLGEVMTRLNGDLEALLVNKSATDDEKIVVQLGSSTSNWE